MLTGVIFGTIVVAWIAYLVPWYLGRRDQGAQLDDDAIDGFADSMHVVRRGSDGFGGQGFLTDSGADVSTPLMRRAARFDHRRAMQIAVKRRRLGLVVHLSLVVIGAIIPFFAPLPHTWSLIPVGLLFVFLILSRISTVTVNRMIAERRASVSCTSAEPTVLISPGSDEETTALTANETERSIRLSDSPDTIGSLWDPIPVTPTAYTSRPLLPRSVRTIDLAAPVASSEVRVPVTADQQPPAGVAEQASPQDAQDEQASAVEDPEAQQDELPDMPRAVGE
ncbi:hypothetical protein GCM10009785_14460 [Brooklawnia cerclae]|uniref:Uncharacterized protein n=1 Tax=Brooklawnia cerclae TaxID=349934 RepID=A0ABX0SI15_9ACTN|nr:hypothetical protein [Brooklawnia cerclae]NIH57984.1 hypothetical protein [Brooklawnia cerclae]